MGWRNRMNKKTTLVMMLVMTMLVLTGCGKPVYTQDNLINCEEGEYNAAPEAKEYLKDLHVELDRIQVKLVGSECVVVMHYKEPMIVLGTEVWFMEVNSVDMRCVEEQNKNNRDANLCVN